MLKLLQIILFISSCFIFNPVSAQLKLDGTIVDKSTLQPVEYANIGFYEKGTGTVCDAFGKFELIIPSDLLDQSVTITHLGYRDTTFSLKMLDLSSGNLTIALIPLITTLKEITITSSDDVNLGYTPGNDEAKGFIKASGLGLEGGTLIRNAQQIVLSTFHLKVLEIPFDSLKFRLNIYSIEKGKPTAKLNTKDIIFKLTKSDTGSFSLPVENESIQVNGDFVCSLELIELYGKNPDDAMFVFSAIRDKKGLIFRKMISMGGWEKIKNFSLCFWLTAKH